MWHNQFAIRMLQRDVIAYLSKILPVPFLHHTGLAQSLLRWCGYDDYFPLLPRSNHGRCSAFWLSFLWIKTYNINFTHLSLSESQKQNNWNGGKKVQDSARGSIPSRDGDQGILEEFSSRSNPWAIPAQRLQANMCFIIIKIWSWNIRYD